MKVGVLRADYEQWRDCTLGLDAFWVRKAECARDALAHPDIASKPTACRWFEASVLVAEQNRLVNWRFCLLMLLRARAAGGV